MLVTDQQAAVSRAKLASNLAEHNRLLVNLDDEADGRAFSALFTAAFYTAVDSRSPRTAR